MPKQSQQKLKILYIYKLLFEKSDEENPISTKDIIAYLEEKGISAERKSVYDDLENLRAFGADIISNGKAGHYIASRTFELAELKLLVDCVQANRFITEKKSAQLIKKLESLTSSNLARSLQRQVYIANRVKGLNEKVYYNTDTLHEAITRRQKIAFQYFTYTPDKQKMLKRDGSDYIASPYALTVSEENYYLVAYYEKRKKITNFRVDRMENIRILNESVPDLKSVAGENFDIGAYAKKHFNMFTGEMKTVTLSCRASLINAVIDRFGEKAVIIPENDEYFTLKADVNVSPAFFSWVFMFGGDMKITAPSEVAAEFKQTLNQF